MTNIEEIRNAAIRLEGTLFTAQATMSHLRELLAMSNQPLPGQKAPLAGDDPLTENDALVLEFVATNGAIRATYLEEHIALPTSELARVVDSLVRRKLLDTFTDAPGNVWYRPFPDKPLALSSNEKDILDFIAGLGTVPAQTVEMNIALPSQEVWRALTSLTQRGLIESFYGAHNTVWYRLPVDVPPASGKRTIDAPWIPDEMPDSGEMVCSRNARCTLGPFHNEPCNAPTDEPQQSEAPPIANHPTPTLAEEPGGKTTAREWRNSKHFLKFMGQPEFKQWNAEEQNTRGDQFVAHVESQTPTKRMGRWGQQFKIHFKMKEKK